MPADVTSGISLGFHYHIPAISQDDGIFMPGYLGRFVDSLACLCRQIVCFMHTPRPDEQPRMDYRIVNRNVRLVGIGRHASVMHRTLHSRAHAARVARHARSLDLLLVRGPSPLLPAMVAASPVPTAVLLVGDYLLGVDDLPQPRWRKEAIRIWSYWNKVGQGRAIRRSLTFVNSRLLYNQLEGKAARLREIRTTTLAKDDFHVRSDTCQTQPCRLLYVGRMSRAKGLLDIVEAVALLRQRGEAISFDLVGWAESGDPIIAEINALASARQVSELIRIWGPIPLGPELFTKYRQADVFVTASLASEGFPRAIWEAMASSLPVIATRVGSIPALVEEAAELVAPGRPSELADAVSRLIHEPQRRRTLITRGLQVARGNTLEAQAQVMMQAMQSWLEAQHA